MLNNNKKKKLKVVLVVAAKEGHRCGVVDYTVMLQRALICEGVNADVVGAVGESITSVLLKLLSEVFKGKLIVHLQYPSMGMGSYPWIMALPLFSMRGKLIISLHEFEKFGWLRKLYMVPVSLFASKVIYTNIEELQCATRWLPYAQSKSQVVPVGTNIPPVGPAPSNRSGMVYFGQLTSGKGIEEYLRVVACLRDQRADIRCSIVGSFIATQSIFNEELRNSLKQYDVELFENLEPEGVSRVLLMHEYAVLPFPDGVSDKRGSAMACLEHGLRLITVHSAKTPSWLMNCTADYIDAANAASIVTGHLSGRFLVPDAVGNAMSISALKERSWTSIAALHANLYGVDCSSAG